MTDTNPRDLIQNMAEELDLYREIARENCWAVFTSTHPLADQARAYLAQPEPEEPTDEELTLVYARALTAVLDNKRKPFKEEDLEAAQVAGLRAVLARCGRPVFQQKELTDEQLLKCFKIATPCYNMEGWRRELDGMRAAIAADRTLCARPALKPVPVSEGLPKAEYCDAQGNCWLTNDSLEPGWVLDNPEKCTNWTHWVPHWAMPIVTK